MLKQLIRSRACLLACAVLLAACGGGGGSSNGGGGTSGTGGSATSAALTFTPSTATATLDAGVAGTVAVGASVNRPNDFNSTVYAFVVDKTGVLLPNANIVAQSPTQYSAILQTSASLAPGSHKGSFTVNLCRDQACSQHFPGSPMQLPYDFTVRAAMQTLAATPTAALKLTVNKGSAPPAPVTVNVGGTQLKWVASSDASWIVLKNAGGTGSGNFTVEFDTSKAAEGIQAGSIEVTTADGQRVVLDTSLTTIAPSFSVSNTGFVFTAVNGAPIDPQQVSFNLDGGGTWSADSNVAWLSATPTSGTLPGQLGLGVDPSKGSLPSGQHTGHLTLKSPTGKDRNLSVELNLVKPEFYVPPNTIYLGGDTGREARVVQVPLQTNTKWYSWPWAFGTLPAWLNVSARSGLANQTGTVVEFTPNLNNAPVGSSTAVINATLQVNGDTVVKPITVAIYRDQQKLLPSETGVAMVSVPGWSRLTRTVTVRDNFAANTAWTASSDQAWLNVSRSGNQLTLTGNPAALPSDATSYATVTLSTSAVGVSAPEVIRVALWKGSTPPSAQTVINTNYTKVIADAIRPLVYAHNGGTSLDVYNVYTGQKVTTAALGVSLGGMAVSQNGERLYVYDATNRNIVVLNASTLAKQGNLNQRSDLGTSGHLVSVRPNGAEILITSKGEALKVSNGQALSMQVEGGFMTATRDGKRLYVQNEGISPSTARAYDIDFTAIAGGTLHMAYVGSFSGGENGRDIAAGLDGSRFYTANGYPYRCAAANAANMGSAGSLPGGDSYPNNVEVDSFGRVYCGISGWYSAADVWVHDSSGAQLKQFKFAGYARALRDNQMVVSADGMMLIGLTDDPLMAIIAVGP